MSVAELPSSCQWTGEGGALLPVTLPRDGGRGEQRRGSILLEVFFIFFRCYINMLKGAFNLNNIKRISLAL